MNSTRATINKTRKGISIALIAVSVLLIGFALLSGSEAYDGGLDGIIQNSPNSSPWVILLLASLISLKRPLFGGFLVLMIGLGMFFFFNFRGDFFLSTFIISLLILLLGLVLIMCGYYLKKAHEL